MSKRKSDNTYINKDIDQVNTRSQYKRARLNEEGQDAPAPYQNNEEDKDNIGPKTSTLQGGSDNKNAPDEFFSIFFRIIQNLHSFSQKASSDKKLQFSNTLLGYNKSE